MWFYRFRDSSPLNNRVLKGLLIRKGEWTEARVKMDFGAFNRFLEDKFEQTTKLEPKVKKETLVKSEPVKKKKATTKKKKEPEQDA